MEEHSLHATKSGFWFLIALVAPGTAGYAAVNLVSLSPSLKSPQVVGRTIQWVATATDTNTGPLMFQFNVGRPGGPLALAQDFNIGKPNAGNWTSDPFIWTPTGVEGIYQIQVVVKDFKSGETDAKTIPFQVAPLVTGTTPVIVGTGNPLVALFSAPSCPAGSSMRVYFQENGKANAAATNWAACHPPNTMTFEVAGMYPGAAYKMHAQTQTGTVVTDGPILDFTAGSIPAQIPVPSFTVITPATDKSAPTLLHNLVQLGGGTHYPDVATDLTGHILWYYQSSGATDLLTRPLLNGGALTIQAGQAWNKVSPEGQMLRQIDLAGHIVRETNTGSVQQQLLALGAADGGPCDTIPRPAPVGAACLGAFHHDAIQFTIGASQFTAAIADIEKIFPAGTQGDTSGLPVDIIGDMIVVLDSNWRVAWYFDTFQHANGAPQLSIERPAVLGDTCVSNQTGCPPIFLLGSGIAPKAKDWLHANSLYYWPQSGDIIWSSRNQDWVMKINYQNGKGNGNIVWRMGRNGDFAFNNIYNDSWPWFSGQHDVGMENSGAGPLTLFDNGNTRVSPSPLGLGNGNSRGMAVTFDEKTMQVTPVLSASLGVYSDAMGSAQLLPDGTYFFQPAIVVVNINLVNGNSIQMQPLPGTDGGTQILNLQGPEHYRGWQMVNLYNPPAT